MSIDPITGKIIQHRVYNKINYQTSFTDFKIFHLYCKTFQQAGLIQSNRVNAVLGQARKRAKSWNNDSDSHAKVTLLQYNLIDEVIGDMYELSTLGHQFLSLFNEEGELTADRSLVLDVLFSMLVGWHQNDDNFNIHPGLILLKLMLQPELHYYITDQDVACIFNNTNNRNDNQYPEFVKQILEFRDSGKIYTKGELKKTYTLLTGYANNWGIFVLEPRSNSSVKYVHLADDFKDVVLANLGVLSEDKVMTDQEYTKLIEENIDYETKIAHYEQTYGELGTVVSLHKTRVSEIQQMFRNRLIKAYGQKCLMCEITNKELLIASHIKADAHCASIAEKIDNNNGFLLCAMHDKLFDRFLISFNARTGKIMISKNLTHAEIEACRIDQNFQLSNEMLTPERRRYLVWHNIEFGKKEQ